MENCPVLSPSPQEFDDFYTFILKAEQLYSDKFGLIKYAHHQIVPPKSFQPRLQDYQDSLKKLFIEAPIEQNTFGKGGCYECLHIQKKGMLFEQYKRKVCPLDSFTSNMSNDDVQQAFWKNISFSPPLYGADLRLSLMQVEHSWNLRTLKSVLSMGLSEPLDGVNIPYCYFGAWKSFFCWHTEDLDLQGINYLHYGKSKYWYSVPLCQRQMLQNEMRRLFPQNYSRCSQFLRHKTFIVNPQILLAKNPELKISKAVQNRGQFIVVFGGAYHCGFNSGFNIAQAVNFATPKWLELFPKAKTCRCKQDSVMICKKEFAKNLGKSLLEKEYIKRFRSQIRGQISLKRIMTSKALQSRKIRKRQAVDLWAQCETCLQWHRLKRGHLVTEQDSFSCQDIGLQCR